MYKHILIPTDGSKLSLAAAKAGAKLASDLGAKVTSLYVMAPYLPPMDAEAAAFFPSYSARDYEKATRKSADAALAKVKAAMSARKVDFDGMATIGASPWKAIIDAAKSRDCDLIVMASHGRRGIEALLLGSETQKVLTHSKVPVLVCR